MIGQNSIPRRQFLAAAVVGSVGVLSAAAKAAEKDDPYGGFLVGVQTYTFRNFDLEPALKRIQALGLKYGEFFSKHIGLDASKEKREAFLKLCKEYDVQPRAWGVQGFTKDHEKNKLAFEFGAALGLKAISADPTPDSFDSLDKLCDQYRIAVAIHPHGPVGNGFHRWDSAETIMKAVKDHHELIGACLDTGHLIRCAILDKKLDPAEQIRVMGKRNFGLHLKDNDNEAEKRGVAGGASNVVFGKGSLNVASVLKALRDVQFKSLISIEYEAKPNDPSADVKACLDVFQQAVKKG